MSFSKNLFWNVAARKLMLSQKAEIVELDGQCRLSRTVVDAMIAFGVSIEPKNIKKYVGKLGILKLSLDRWQEEGFTPLHSAAVNANGNLVELHKGSCDPNARDSKGRTPLQLCAFFGHLDVAKRLINAGAHPDYFTRSFGTPYSQAIKGDEREMANYLSELETTTACDRRNYTPFQQSVICGTLNSPLKTEDEFVQLATALFAIKKQRREQAKEIYDRMIQVSPDSKTLNAYHKEETIRRNLYHSWKINWNISKSAQVTTPQTLFYETADKVVRLFPFSGCYGVYYLHKMAKNTRAFSATFSQDATFNVSCLALLEETLDVAANQRTLSAEALFNRYRSYKPLILAISIPRHFLTALIWGPYFILCNRGACRRQCIEVFRFQPHLLTIPIIARLITRFESDDEYCKFMFSELPILLGFYQTFVQRELEALFSLPPQFIGNCSWENPEGIGYCFLLLHALREQGLLEYRMFDKQAASLHIAKRSTMFLNWLLFQQLEYLEKYLALSNPATCQFVSNNEMYPVIRQKFHFFQQAAWVHPQLLEKMHTLVKNYPILAINEARVEA